MTFEPEGLHAFVQKGDDVRETARMLVNLADQHGISQSDIFVANDGFYVSDELADLIGSDEPVTAGDVATDLGVQDGFGEQFSEGERGDTIGRDREAIAISEEIADTNEQVTAADEDSVTADAIEEHDTSGVIDVDYDEWDYARLKVEVSSRGLETSDQKTPTLIAALKASDIAPVEDGLTEPETGDETE